MIWLWFNWKHENKIKLLYRTVTGRSPSDIEIEKLARYYDDENLGDDFLAFNKLTMLVYNLDETSQKS